MKKRFAGSYDARCGGISFRTDKWDSVWVVRAWIGGEDLRYQEIAIVGSIKRTLNYSVQKYSCFKMIFFSKFTLRNICNDHIPYICFILLLTAKRKPEIYTTS